MNLELTVFGTGSANPQIDRNPSAYLFSIENEYILFDCGEGTQYRFLEYKVKHTRLRYILISHLHGDHFFGLIGLLSTFNLNQRSEPITVIGPKGLQEIIELQLKYSLTKLHFELMFIETNPTISEQIYETSNFTIQTIPLVHRVPCTGFLLKTKPSKRKIIKEKISENFPVPYILKLKDGINVTDELSGETYTVEEFTTEGTPSKSFAYCSDTAYEPSIIPIIKGADLLFHEATFTTEHAQRAAQTFHSTAQQAAEIALSASVKQLLIGHYSSRYKELETHLNEAKAVFENTLLATEGLSIKI